MTDGLKLAGRYQLLEMIDSGGSSYIYQALDTKLNTIVAAKVLKSEFVKNAVTVERFKKEGQAALRLKHANIIQTTDAGADGDSYFIIMDFINGRTLKHIININEPLPVKFVVNAAKKLCLALEYAHVKGLVHRDIKPHNMMIDTDGEPYITDFGIAEKITPAAVANEPEDNVMGSVHYFSPEQARGEKVDKRSDIYSFGIVLYEMLTGKVPFDGETTVEIALQHLNQPMPEIPKSNDIPPSLNRIIQKATQKDKNLRYKSAFAMYEDLCRCLTERDGSYIRLPRSPKAAPVLPGKHKRTTVGARNILFGSLGILAFIVILLLIFNMNFNKSFAAVTVPNVVNSTSQEAQDAVTHFKLVPNLVNNFSNNVVSGVVISQDPQAGSQAKEGDTINIYVSVGPEMQHMPSVLGMAVEDAKELLKTQGIVNVSVIQQTNGSYADGTVISQVPDENDTITANDQITLTVKSSSATLSQKAPPVTNTTLPDALDTLKALGYQRFYIYEEQNKNKSNGVVVNQNPASGVSQSVSQPFIMWVAEYSNAYNLSETLNLKIDDDDSLVTIALKTAVNGTDVYFILKESHMDTGTQRLDLSAQVGLPSDDDELQAQLVVFINDFPAKTVNVTLQNGG
jgi:eukaryotic-like serine/threonine-protein kinase